MNANRMDSRTWASSAGSASGVGTRASGMGSTQASPGRVAPVNRSAAEDGPRSMVSARRWRPRSMSRHTLVAMRYSHERSADRPSKRSKPRQARSMVSWTASSASKTEPSMR